MLILNSQIGTRKYCGTTPPRNFTAPAKTNVTAVFVSDNTVHRKGFLMTWNKKSMSSQIMNAYFTEKYFEFASVRATDENVL